MADYTAPRRYFTGTEQESAPEVPVRPLSAWLGNACVIFLIEKIVKGLSLKPIRYAICTSVAGTLLAEFVFLSGGDRSGSDGYWHVS